MHAFQLRARPLLLLAVVVVIGALAGASMLFGGTRERAAIGKVTIDLKAKRQVIQGFGTSERVWSDPHLSKNPTTTVHESAQREMLAALYTRLGLTRVRNVLDAGIQAGPGQPMDFTGKRGDAHVAFVKQARPYGLKTFFPGPRGLESWMKESDPGATVDWAMGMLRHWRALGVEPALYAPLNEPEVAQDFAPKWMHDVVVMLGRRLRAEGFKTKL